jgi:hypothetical protein
MSFIAGRYTATWNALAMGQTKVGYDIEFQRFTEDIIGDNYAQMVQDAINLGGEFTISTELIEYNAAAAATLMWPLSATKYDTGVIGILDSGKWMSLVLTALAGTPAAATPATMTTARSILHPRFPVKFRLGPSLRTLPLRLRAYPNAGVFATET